MSFDPIQNRITCIKQSLAPEPEDCPQCEGRHPAVTDCDNCYGTGQVEYDYSGDAQHDIRWLLKQVEKPQRTYTAESDREAWLILDDARANGLDGEALAMACEMAAQKLRPVAAPDHDEAALEQLAQKYPIQLLWMQNHIPCGECGSCYAGEPCAKLYAKHAGGTTQPIIAAGTPSDGGRANCLNSDCAGCEKGGEGK
ncbi:hypothetical protein [Hymenobacter glacieicola]|uniref:Uncharacterized protein n=1 Tax=Hymenobacter glacieicola TaxID=1562124 RepID=A0ABQ1WKJ0_9BACT|nr:hypothetical protein [Hymenobacter glacieicola]GGG34016.1 hypothetical protein GCM10011378_08050 [Hymenobacter glacieicola]